MSREKVLLFVISQLINEHEGLKELMEQLKLEIDENFRTKYTKYNKSTGNEIISTNKQDAIAYFLDTGTRNTINDQLQKHYNIVAFNTFEFEEIKNLIEKYSINKKE